MTTCGKEVGEGCLLSDEVWCGFVGVRDSQHNDTHSSKVSKPIYLTFVPVAWVICIRLL